jgi:hypothetical protein
VWKDLCGVASRLYIILRRRMGFQVDEKQLYIVRQKNQNSSNRFVFVFELYERTPVAYVNSLVCVKRVILSMQDCALLTTPTSNHQPTNHTFLLVERQTTFVNLNYLVI